MAKSNNNKIYVGIAAIAAAIMAIVGIIVATGGGDYGNSNGNDGSGNETSQGDESDASDFNKVDIVVEYGDYDTMYELSRDIQNGYATGKIVKIDGDVSNSGTMYSIVQKNETGNTGARFIMESEADYPNDQERVVITGEVVELEPLIYVIKTSPEFVEIQD